LRAKPSFKIVSDGVYVEKRNKEKLQPKGGTFSLHF